MEDRPGNKSGYLFNRLDIKFERPTSFIGSKVIYLPETDSTNNSIKTQADAGLAEGGVVVADSQTAGRGRLGRQWFSPPGANLYFSILLKPKINPELAAQFTLLASIAAHEAIENRVGLATELKWPNDLLIDGKKLCGILSEMEVDQNKLSRLIIGIGINCNIGADDFPAPIADIATSLMIETGQKIDRRKLLIELFDRLEIWYFRFKDKGLGDIRERWSELAEIAGKTITVKSPAETFTGTGVGISESGALILENRSGERRRFLAGDVTIQK